MNLALPATLVLSLAAVTHADPRHETVRSSVDSQCMLTVAGALTGANVDTKLSIGLADACRTAKVDPKLCKVKTTVDDDTCMATLSGMAPARACQVTTMTCDVTGVSKQRAVDTDCVTRQAHSKRHSSSEAVKIIQGCVKEPEGSCVALQGTFDQDCFVLGVGLIGASPAIPDALELARTCHRTTMACDL
jgi:hypothetical protein